MEEQSLRQNLLPPTEAAPACADWSEHIGANPVGTALSVTHIVLIEVPLPWPKPVFAHPQLAGLRSMVRLSDGGLARVLATVPRESGLGDARRMVVYERNGSGASRSEFWVSSAAEQAKIVQTELVQPEQSQPDQPSQTPQQPAILICIHGSHDECCGERGTQLANELESTLVASNQSVEIFRVSHMGGHRFAPTTLTLPDGRMWGGLDLSQTLGILNRTANAATFKHCRGWWGANEGPEQVGEHAVLGEVGWSLNDCARQVTSRPADSGFTSSDEVTSWVVDVACNNGRSWQAEVAAGRKVPVVSCRSPGGLPAKTSREYTVTSLRQLS